MKISCIQVPQIKREYEQEMASSHPTAVEEAPTAFEVVATQEQEILGASSKPDMRPMECTAILCVKSVCSAVIIAGIYKL